MIILGITGTLGAGKGTVVNYLVEHKGFCHYSVRSYLKDIILERGMGTNRDSMVKVANELRSLYGPSFIIDKLYEQAKNNGRDSIIESIRTYGEIESLRSKGNFTLIAVIADPHIRFKRVRKRNSETDMISFKTFLENEKREMSSEDPNKQNLGRCIAEADYVINNDGSVEELEEQVEQILDNIKR